MNQHTRSQTTLILGGTGKTGRRVTERLATRGLPVRVASRTSDVRFDWYDDVTWAPALRDVGAAYITYYPDLAVPSAAEHLQRFSRAAVDSGVKKLVLLSGRGEHQVYPAERAVRESGAAYTILRCAFFFQNFSEGAIAPHDSKLAFPGGRVAEPFIDADDIADVAVAALTDESLGGTILDLTGPRLMTFDDVAADIAAACGRPLAYVPITFEDYGAAMASHVPPAHVAFFLDLFRYLLDGHNALLTGDVARVLGRAPRDFREFATRAVEQGAWR